MKGINLRDREVVLVHGARTPLGTFCGAFTNISATDLAVVASKEAMRRSRVKPEEIDQVIFGNVLQTSPDAVYCARHVGLKAGVPKEIPALTLNRLCGSGFQAIVAAAEQVLLGRAKIVLAGGTENMTQAPHTVRGARLGLPLGKSSMNDYLWEALLDSYNNLMMANTAENLARKYKITREEADQFALRSQQMTKAAQEAGRLGEEIVAVETRDKKGKPVVVAKDEHPRSDATMEGLAKLPPVFEKNGIVTAGNASGICDGAAALVVMAKDEADKRGISYLGTLVAYGVSGCDPDIMGIGPVPAARKALTDFGKTLGDIDLIEVNEAFAPQTIAVERELGIAREKLNVNGGAIALGHPLGASGARITLSLLMELRRRKKRWGLGSACIGGGQGIAVILEAAGK
ncbi:MAG TPA: acetyl-CoA C-acetyltransferase [Bdellovibrionota bacterium]|nr:acetyl-CoA C-acetyltransferase [Bdellovibrionota bacterium]